MGLASAFSNWLYFLIKKKKNIGFWLTADPNPQDMGLNLSIRKVNIGGLRTLMESD
jgi:hypothetical protein